jgi:hypothetical protein
MYFCHIAYTVRGVECRTETLRYSLCDALLWHFHPQIKVIENRLFTKATPTPIITLFPSSPHHVSPAHYTDPNSGDIFHTAVKNFDAMQLSQFLQIPENKKKGNNMNMK